MYKNVKERKCVMNVTLRTSYVRITQIIDINLFVNQIKTLIRGLIQMVSQILFI